MNVKRLLFIFAAATILIFPNALHVHADQCEDELALAKKSFADAQAASKNNEHANAAQLFDAAGSHYQKALKSNVGRCPDPDVASTIKENAEICAENAATSRKSLGEERAVKIYNEAVTKFNEGNTYSSNREWKLAFEAFEEAEKKWRSIASTETERGKQALESADQAKQSAELARKRMGN